ncbi:MAG TPA: zinc-dependent metalloprotease [Gemmatimonadaceae bacterium]|nr:zinc-dependent metalloprotease [Gemmatimonadaceae bacterium]
MPTPPPDTTQTPGGGAGRGGRGQGGRGGGGGAAGEPNPQPYNQVVRGGMTNKVGMIKTHQNGNQLLFEVPKSLLNKDILVLTEIEKTTNNVGQGGQSAGSKVMRFTKRGDRILLQNIAFNIIADPSLPVAKAVENANVPQIVGSYNVEAYNPQDSAAVIDVSQTFLAPPPEISPGAEFQGTPAANRSFIEKAPSWPTNTNVHATLTYAGGGRGGAAGAGRGGGGGGRGGAPPASATIGMMWTFYKLPDTPMMPRLFDDRVGFFSSTQTDYGLDVPRSKQTRYIARYRLECSDRREGNLCYPKKPIVYYVDPATPTKWIPWIKRAIEDWQPAFEAAGFKQAIIAKDAPTAQEDPDWSYSDARYSVIDWLPSSTENASGPHISDPRSGEIMNAHVQLYHNVLNLARDWYFTQAGPNDPRAQKLPLPDDLMGRLLEYVVAHEVGHTIGLQHDQKGSGTYEVDSLRSPTWVHKMGHTPSIMDYSRFNYVAQPEDKVDPADLIPKVGPYDIFAIAWGYKPIPTAKTMWDEIATLDQWARVQDNTPWLRFATVDAGGTDPEENTEAVGDKDPMKSAMLGQKNIKRVMDNLLAATSTNPYETIDDLQELYNRVVGQWRTEMSHVTTQIGGATTQEKYNDQPGARFFPVSKAKEKEAVKFINENVFKTPQFLVPEAITRRVEPAGSISRVTSAQTSILNSLINEGKMNRLVEYEALSAPGTAYSLIEYLGDIRQGVFTELATPTPKVDAFRRALQRSYLETVKSRLNPPAADSAAGGRGGGGGGRGGRGGGRGGLGDARGVLRGELRQLDAQLKLAIPKASDKATKLHFEDLRTEIADILKGKLGEGEVDQ